MQKKNIEFIPIYLYKISYITEFAAEKEVLIMRLLISTISGQLIMTPVKQLVKV